MLNKHILNNNTEVYMFSEFKITITTLLVQPGPPQMPLLEVPSHFIRDAESLNSAHAVEMKTQKINVTVPKTEITRPLTLRYFRDRFGERKKSLEGNKYPERK